MSSLELKDLPDHVIQKILSYIPDHYEISSVCKLFYELDCNNTRNNLNLMLHFDNARDSDHKCDEKTLESILASNRTIRRMHFRIDFHNPAEIENAGKIFRRHGESVTELTLNKRYVSDEEKSEIPEQTLIHWLNCFTNLKKLILCFDSTSVTKSKDCNESLEILKLPKLEELTICSKSLAFFVDRLPTGLRKFDMKFEESGGILITDEEDLQNHVLKMQLLEKLKKMKLEELAFWDMSGAPIEPPEYLSLLETQQDSLTSLGAFCVDQFVEAEFFRQLIILNQLESLKLNFIDNFPAESFSKLTKLTRLEICLDSDMAQISQITTVPLKELIVDEVTDNCLLQIGQNYPIKYLKINNSKEKLIFYMQNFPHLESLDLSHYSEDLSSKISGIYWSNRVPFPNLKTLIVSSGFRSRRSSSYFIFEILVAFPNLKELQIHEKIYVNNEFLRILKMSLGRLRKFKFDCLVFSDVDQFCNEGTMTLLQELSNDLDSAHFVFHIDGLQQKRNSSEFLDMLRGYFRINLDQNSLTLRKNF